MNLSIKDSLVLASSVNNAIKKEKNHVIICPDFISLPLISLSLDKHNFSLGAQNMASMSRSASTGEVSALNLKEVGVDYVIIGHSERRINNFETDKEIGLKIKLALDSGLRVIFCVGENLKSQGASFVLKQLRASLKNIKLKNKDQIVLAYEPVWSIGSGKSMSAVEVDKMLGLIKVEAEKILNRKLKTLYGGSVNKDNAKDFFKQKNVDGLLVGTKSLDLDEFLSICSL